MLFPLLWRLGHGLSTRRRHRMLPHPIKRSMVLVSGGVVIVISVKLYNNCGCGDYEYQRHYITHNSQALTFKALKIVLMKPPERSNPAISCAFLYSRDKK